MSAAPTQEDVAVELELLFNDAEEAIQCFGMLDAELCALKARSSDAKQNVESIIQRIEALQNALRRDAQ